MSNFEKMRYLHRNGGKAESGKEKKKAAGKSTGIMEKKGAADEARGGNPSKDV